MNFFHDLLNKIEPSAPLLKQLHWLPVEYRINSNLKSWWRSLPVKVKVVFILHNIRSVRPLKAFYTFCPPPPPAGLFIPTPTRLLGESILAMQQLRAKTKSLTFPPLSMARYSFIQLSQLGRQWRERKCPIYETVAKGESIQGSLDCESGILPLNYRAPHQS